MLPDYDDFSACIEAELTQRLIDMSLQDQWHNLQDIKKIPTDADILIAYATVPGIYFSSFWEGL